MQRLCFILCLFFLSCGQTQESPEPTEPLPTQSGLDRVAEYAALFTGKRVGIVTNHTAYNTAGKYITDIFLEMPEVQLTALFGPEHGIRGSAEAGEKVDSDPLRDVPIYSLYGKTKKPTAEMLANVDVLIFDIQDVGARFYTYIYTMAYAMEAVAEQGKKFVVLDRPNPISGAKVEGNILEPGFETFVGLYPIPTVHGMTVGELAKMFNREKWLANGVQVDLTVIPVKNWTREQWYDDTKLPFIKPSPNIPSLTSATIYPGVCLVEGTNMSEGRGTAMPFQILGAPWVDGKELAAALNQLKLPGVAFRDTLFTPVSMPGASTHPKQQDKACGGVRVLMKNRDQFQPYLTGIHIINTVHRLYPDSLQWREKHFDRLCGSANVRETILQGGSIEKLRSSWEERQREFFAIRNKYLLYPSSETL